MVLEFGVRKGVWPLLLAAVVACSWERHAQTRTSASPPAPGAQALIAAAAPAPGDGSAADVVGGGAAPQPTARSRRLPGLRPSSRSARGAPATEADAAATPPT